MTTHATSTRTIGRTPAAIAALCTGLLLTVAATVAPYVDRTTGHVLADHIRHGYPSYTQDRVDAAVDAWLVILTVVGVLGIVCWVGTIWAVKTHKAWARPMATVMLIAGAGSALVALLTKDSSGQVGLAPLLGWIGMLPSLAGLAAVGMLWATPTGRGDPRVKS